MTRAFLFIDIMKKQITEKDIIKISTGEKDIRDVFPEVFETKLEAGEWYKLKGNDECICLFTGDTGCGFDDEGEWREKVCMSKPKLWEIATPQEVEEALIKEAKRRGYEVGVKIKSFLYGGGNVTLVEDGSCRLREEGLFFYGCIVFQNGKWAEIISKSIKKYEDFKEISGYFVDGYCDIFPLQEVPNRKMNYDICKTYEQAEALIALAQLSQLIPEYNGDWVADFNTTMQNKYCIFFYKNEITIEKTICYNYFLAFKTREIAEDFLQNNRELILKAKPFLG